MRTPTIPAVLLTLTLTACANDSPLTPTRANMARIGSAKAGVQVPFRGSITGAETQTLQSPTTVRVNSTGGGTATHLGRFTVTFEAVIQLQTGTGVANFTFIAANGDELFATANGRAVPSAENPGFLEITELATVTGGTGRFVGASGNFTIVRLLNLVSGLSSGSFDGTINVAH